MSQPKRICFVTGTRAEFGLMRSTLRAIEEQPELRLQVVVTGMHLQKAHGRSIDAIRKEGWTVDAIVPWKSGGDLAAQTGAATAGIARALDRLKSDVVLVVGDRVEAFAAATAGHLSRRVVAHVHGGDRAEGQIDDSLRHAITKLSHVHFPATKGSAERLIKLGEDKWRVHQVGSPGLDGIREAIDIVSPQERSSARFDFASKKNARGAALRRRNGPFALVVLHPVDASNDVEFRRATLVLDSIRAAGVHQAVVIYPNNDPGSKGIIRCWQARKAEILRLLPDAPRSEFLELMRDCAVMVGNSSAGIIEAGALGTPVVNVGDRQAGRERGGNVIDVPYDHVRIVRAVRAAVGNGRTTRPDKTHPYGGGNAGQRIAEALARVEIDQRLLRKLIAY